MNKKAFISDSIVDIWAIVLFVLIVITFAILFKFDATAREMSIQDRKDVSYGNYFSQVYLRKPVLVGTEQMSMAELIAFYDYNQTQEKQKDIDQTIKDVFFYGISNSLWEVLEPSIDNFTKNSFDKDRCWVFSILGNGFEYAKFGNCPLMSNAFSISRAMEQFGVPKDAFVTHIASVDPREAPIEVYSVYDVKRMIDLYAPDSYTNMDDWVKTLVLNDCVAFPALPYCQPTDTKK
ncbi:MAG: hypothetical protein V1729_01785 [Candidatus Woesearchaeota archaeon]